MANTKNFNAFFKENKVEQPPVEIYVTDSFVDENGDPILWKIRPIGSEEEKWINDSVIENKKDKRTGTITQIRDDGEYVARICAQAVVYPDLADKDLQTSYGVRKNKTALLRKMLTVGELYDLSAQVSKISGLDDEEDDYEKKAIEGEIEFSKN